MVVLVGAAPAACCGWTLAPICRNGDLRGLPIREEGGVISLEEDVCTTCVALVGVDVVVSESSMVALP